MRWNPTALSWFTAAEKFLNLTGDAVKLCAQHQTKAHRGSKK